jgi:hypothetical protein
VPRNYAPNTGGVFFDVDVLDALCDIDGLLQWFLQIPLDRITEAQAHRSRHAVDGGESEYLQSARDNITLTKIMFENMHECVKTLVRRDCFSTARYIARSLLRQRDLYDETFDIEGFEEAYEGESHALREIYGDENPMLGDELWCVRRALRAA